MKQKKAYVSLILFIITIFSIFTVSCSEKQLPDDSSESSLEQNASSSSSENSDSSESVSEDSNNDTFSQEVIPEDKRVHFVACPDNIMHTDVIGDAINHAADKNGKKPDRSDLHNAEYDFSHIYSDVKDMIQSADLSYLNQETLIGGTSGNIAGYPNFNSPVAVADEDIDLGFDVINVAHNHMLDSGNADYLKYCSELFMERGLTVIGYYPTKESINSIPVIEKNGIKIAFLSYTYGTNGHRLPASSPYFIPYFSKELIAEQVGLAKQVSDFIIVSCHWGYENTYRINDMQEEYAQYLTDLGVDVALGMHSHSVQPIEWKENADGHKTLVIYSLGNFVSGMEQAINMLGLIMQFDIVKDGVTNEMRIENAEAVPIVTHINRKYPKFHIYYLKDYTEELAEVHRVLRFEKSHGTTLKGGGFSKANLIKTLTTVIDSKFLPEEFRVSEEATETSK